MRQAVEWTKKARRQAPADSPFAGLLPAAPADGEFLWDGKHHIVGYDFWNLRGLLCDGRRRPGLGQERRSGGVARRGQARTARRSTPPGSGLGCPSSRPVGRRPGTHWGNTETLWPTPIFPADDPRVAALIDEVRRRHGGGYVEGDDPLAGRRGMPSIPTWARTPTMAELLLRPRRAGRRGFLLVPVALHGRPRLPRRDLLQDADRLERHHPARHRGIELRLDAPPHADPRAGRRVAPAWAPCPTGGWPPGSRSALQRAPTHFGPMNMMVRGTKSGVEIGLEPPSAAARERSCCTCRGRGRRPVCCTAWKSCCGSTRQNAGTFPQLSSSTANRTRRRSSCGPNEYFSPPGDAEDAERSGMKAEGGRRKAANLVSILHSALCIFHFAFLLCVLRVTPRFRK